jgi:hypothetical protein
MAARMGAPTAVPNGQVLAAWTESAALAGCQKVLRPVGRIVGTGFRAGIHPAKCRPDQAG